MDSPNINSQQQKESQNNQPIVDALNQTELFDAKSVGPNTVSAISIMGDKEKLAGNILRRLCKLGGEVCAKECALSQKLIDIAQESVDKKCADKNLGQIFEALGANPKNILMVGVTADEIGFVDEVDLEQDKYTYKINANTGVKELPGFNAFFSREDDTIAGEEIGGIGRRLADCGDINLEFVDKEGKKVMGFMHITKSNLQGPDALKFEYQDKKVGSFEYFLRTATDHYGAELSSLKIRVAAAIKPENAIYTFVDEEKLDTNFPGWKTMTSTVGNPLIRNTTNPDWKPGMTFDPEDKWEADFKSMIEWQIKQVTELRPEQINWDGAIDAGDFNSPHASNTRGKTNPNRNGRDAYFTAWADKLKIQKS